MGRPKKEGGISATDYKRAFNEKNYDRLSPYVKRGKKDRYKAAATAAGYSLNEFMEMAMDRMADEILGTESRHHTRRCRGRPRAPRWNNQFSLF